MAPSTSSGQVPSTGSGQALASVIKTIESGGNPHRPRFEYHAFMAWPWTPAYDRILAKHQCTRDTAQMIAATSWGAYQMLGVNVFDPAVSGVDPDHLFAYVADAQMQDASFAHFLTAKGIDWTLEDLLGDADRMQKFCERWNGPANAAAYAALIRGHGRFP
jgi:hypothetical protein